MLRRSRDVTAPGEQAGNGNVFVDCFPMKADTAHFDLFPLRRCRSQQPGKPCERDAERPPIGQLDPHGVVVEMDASHVNLKFAT